MATFVVGCTGEDKSSSSSGGGVVGNTVEVSTALEFIEAVKPNRTVVLNAGEYNLSTVIGEIEKKQLDNGKTIEDWQEEHPWVKINDGNDLGDWLLFCDLHDFSIETSGDVRIVSEFGGGTVLPFDSCNNMKLGGFKVYCIAVTNEYLYSYSIRLDGCKNVSLYDIETDDIFLWQSEDIAIDSLTSFDGQIGIYCYESKNLEVTDTTIKYCLAPTEIVRCTGSFKFRNCEFTDSVGGCSYSDNDEDSITVVFQDCFFGEGETEGWDPYDYVSTINCSFYISDESLELADKVVGRWCEYCWPDNTLVIEKEKETADNALSITLKFGRFDSIKFSGLANLRSDGLYFDHLQGPEKLWISGRITAAGNGIKLSISSTNWAIITENETRNYVSSAIVSDGTGEFVEFYPKSFMYPSMEAIEGTWYVEEQAHSVIFTVEYEEMYEDAWLPILYFEHLFVEGDVVGKAHRPQDSFCAWPMWSEFNGENYFYGEIWFEQEDEYSEIIMHMATGLSVDERFVLKKAVYAF